VAANPFETEYKLSWEGRTFPLPPRSINTIGS